MNRRPAVKEYLVVVDLVPILDFLLTDIRRKLGVFAQTLKILALDAQWNAFYVIDTVCVGVEPGMF